mmetsp:Transcript_2072/g.6501  ORF Transcript_2072/g.6501 Transcript_2072/m.6501 type:complete len:457 (-) Transcript_2072:35-1405(-)
MEKQADGAAPAKEKGKEQGPADASAAEAALPEKAKRRAVNTLIFGIFQAVLQHVLALQSDVTLFTRASAGDQTATARCLALSTGITGVAGLFLNQIGGKLSDALGRKAFFLAGPLVNILGAAALMRGSQSLFVLMVCRVLRSITITFSGTVMSQAALADICSGQEAALVNTRIQAVVGVAVVAGPYIESLILKLSRGNPLSPFKVMAAAAVLQMVTSSLFLPETLARRKRASVGDFFNSLAALNPCGFVKAYMGKNATLKKLLTIQTFQFCMDGKVTSDLFQMWSRNNLGWAANTARDFVAFWGAAVMAGGSVIHPYLLKRLSAFAYTSLANISAGFGLAMHGFMENGFCMFGGVAFLVPGVNGGSTHAIKALSLDLARAEGYGNGEFSAWANNMRALAQSLDTVFLGMWYARCKERGIYQGTAWFIASFIGAGLPQLMMLTMPRSDFEAPEKLKD